MFHMMNEARVGVGLGATCLGYTGYLHALDYAKGRPQGRPVSAKDPATPQVPIVEHADVRADAAGAEVLRRGRARAQPLLRPAARRGEDRRDAGGARALDAAARRAHADREELAVAVVPGGQQPGDPGARRLRLHPRVPGRAVLPRQPAQPDPRGHARHPGARPARPQGRDARRRRPAAAGRDDDGAPSTARTSAAGSSPSWPRSCARSSSGCRAPPRRCSAPATSRWRWRTPRSTSRPSGTWCSPGCGSSSCSPRTAGPATSTTASGRPGGSSSAWELPRTGPQLDLLESLDTTTLDALPAWF